MFIFFLSMLALAFNAPVPAGLLLALHTFSGSSGSLCYAVLTQRFPVELAGRVNTALNLLVFVSAFATQWAFGAIINQWATGNGAYAAEGYAVAFGGFGLAGLAALAVFTMLDRRSEATLTRT